ncbi:MAG: ParB N-terminal domain-containing protein [Desulfobulbia bacterium]
MRHEDRLIKIERILPNPYRDFDIYPINLDSLEDIKKSYGAGASKDFGTIIPIRVHPDRKGYYQQACGHHRMAAFKKLGVLELPCRIRDMDDDEMVRVMTNENSANYGHNPDSVNDSVAAFCKRLIYILFSCGSVDDLSHLSDKTGLKLPSLKDDRSFNRAKTSLIEKGTIGEPLISEYAGNSTLKRAQIDQALRELNATNKLQDIAAKQRKIVDIELAAKRKAEKEAERKAKKAAEDLKKQQQEWARQEEARKKLRAEEAVDRKKRKAELDATAEKERKLREKAERMAAARRKSHLDKLAKEEFKRQRKAAEEREKQEKRDKAIADAKVKQAEQAPAFIDSNALAKLTNRKQREAFISITRKDTELFPIEEQQEYMAQMISDLGGEDKLTTESVKTYMNKRVLANNERLRRIMEEEQRQKESRDKEAKALRINEELQTAFGRLQAVLKEYDRESEDPEMANYLYLAPKGIYLADYLDSLEKSIPSIRKKLRQRESAVTKETVVKVVN